MSRFYHRALLGFTAFSVIACSSPVPPPASQAAARGVPRELLSRLVEGYWDETGAMSPWYSWGGTETRQREASADAISPQDLADSLAVERRYLAATLDIPRAALDADSTTTYDIFLRERLLAIESFTYPMELMPVNPYDATPQKFAVMAAAAERYALSSARDFENWQARAMSFVRWTDQAIANMREGIRRGYTLPRVLVERTLPLLAALGEDTQANVFYQPLRSGPARSTPAVTAVIKDKILPCYRALHDFLRDEYLPRSRASVGLTALPLGEAWYAHVIKRATGSASDPAQLHALGVAEVERLHRRVQTLLAATPPAGTAQNFLDTVTHEPGFSDDSPGALLNAFQELKVQVAAATPASFPVPPAADFEIRSVEDFRAATSAAASYRRSMAYGKTAAVLYVNTAVPQLRPGAEMMSLYLREAVPGHHFQLALQEERPDLPKFRRFGGAPAFISGWGLYAASLGDELGLYRDPRAKFGALLAQLDCAAGLVIDTGLHAQNWSRQRALDYLHAEMPIDAAAAANAVDRDLAVPGEVLACTVGFLKIQGLRARAQQILGARFDVRAFHTEVLKNGAVPLDVLEADLTRWMETVRTQIP